MSSDALDYISIEGFKSISQVDRLELRPVNVIIGPNGSGKSNFIGVFSFLHAIREGRLAEYVGQAGGAEKVLHFGSKVTKSLRIRLSFGGEVNGYEISLTPTSEDGLFPSGEVAYFWDRDLHASGMGQSLQPASQGREAGISNPNVKTIARWVRGRMGSWRVYHIHDTSKSSPMRKTAKVDDNAFLRDDGSNIAAYLYFLRNEFATAYRLIRSAVQRVAPFFDDFELKPRQLNPDDIRLEWRHKNSDQYFDASSLSDGTLRFIVLATLFLLPKHLRPSVILVDEPELGLHPYAVGLLASLVRQASAETQVIVSTQSSLLLDHFEPADVLVANRVDGGTQLGRLDANSYTEWLKEYSLGQLWEKNELGGRP